MIAPFVAVTYLAGSLPNVFLYLLMSLLFPLAVVIFYWRSAKKDLAMQLAVTNFIVALAYAFVLGEEINMTVANFWNCVQYATFVLFMVSVTFFGKKMIVRFNSGIKLTWRELTGSGLLAVHFICGLVYYGASLVIIGSVKI